MAHKKLFLLDGMALIYRAHFALSKNPRFTSAGLNTSAMMGFTNTLLEILKKEQPTHIAVVFDTSAPTERHTDYEAYKAHREQMPEDLSRALPYVVRIIEGFNIPVITLDGYEADDIIGTLAKKAEIAGFQVFCMTPDKDFGQLVSDNIFIYKPSRMGNDMEILGVPEILKKWEIERVDQVIDILGLWGDAVDNIPGIPGIGEKTAKDLIKRYGTMENIIANSHELKGKQRENVEQFSAQGLLSKKLATILLNVPVELEENKLILEAPDREKLEPIFAELEFRTIGRRVFGEEFKTADKSVNASGQFSMFGGDDNLEGTIIPTESDEPRQFETMATSQHNYVLVDTKEKRDLLIVDLLKQKEISFDTETTGTDANNCELVGLSFSFKIGEAYYIPAPKTEPEIRILLEEFKPVLENPSIIKIGQNIKYDILVLKWYDVEIKGILFDTMLAHYIIDPDTRHNMDVLAENYLNYSPVSITELIGKKGKDQLNMADIDVEIVKDYAAEDADVTLRLKHTFEPLLKDSNSTSLANDIENPLIYVLAAIEKEGVAIDTQALKEFSKELETTISSTEKNIFEHAGLKFNIASPKQLGEVLFDKLQLDPKAKKTKTGQYQTGEDVLSYLAPKHEIVNEILIFRSLQKLKST